MILIDYVVIRLHTIYIHVLNIPTIRYIKYTIFLVVYICSNTVFCLLKKIVPKLRPITEQYFTTKQGRKRPLDTLKRMIKRRERRGKREKERYKERYREGVRDKRDRERKRERERERGERESTLLVKSPKPRNKS